MVAPNNSKIFLLFKAGSVAESTFALNSNIKQLARIVNEDGCWIFDFPFLPFLFVELFRSFFVLHEGILT